MSQVSGAATTGANTFSGTEAISSGNLALPATTASTSGVITLGGLPFIHAYGNWNTFVGSGAGNFGMTGSGGNVGVGQSALISDTTGSNNVAIGFHSLLSNTIGSANIAVGSAALLNNISGTGNAAYGGSALVFNVLGNSNTAIGGNALYNNKSDSNTALGYSAGYNQATGSNNIYIGYYVQGIDGENNTIRIGNGTTQAYIAGTVNATGFSGNGSGLTNVIASGVAGTVPVANGGTGATIAAGALANLGAVSLTGSYADPAWITSLSGSKINGNISGNSANVTGIVAVANGGTGAANVSAARSSLGIPGLATTNIFSAGPQTFATGAAGNIALLVQGAPSQIANLQEWRNSGGTALASISSAGDLTTSGNINLPASTTTSGLIKSAGSTFIHGFGAGNFFAGLSAGNQTMTGDTNTASGANALHGNTSGSYNTATGASSLISNNSGGRNTATGTYALQNNIGGSYNTAIAYGSLIGNTGGSGNTAVGYEAGQAITTGTYNTFIGYSADASANYFTNATAIGNGATVDASNKVRIGNSFVTVIEGPVNMTVGSDSRLKKDVEYIGQGLAFIRALRPVQYRLKNGNDRIDFGFIAQDIEALLGTEYNVLGVGADSERTLSLRYTDFIAPLVKAMQEQQEMIESQKYEIKALEERLSRFEMMKAR
ncbi:MAG: tail fiber domain-containing protein [Desulfuromonadales bacterium]|nr:tail fiber domain-containing protein [Desulfuromonadales bacterium]